MKKTKVNRSYKLKLFGSKSKFEDLNWSSKKYINLTNMFSEHLYFNTHIKFYSTKGFGELGNQAQRKALGMVKSRRISEGEFGHKKRVPFLTNQVCFAHLKKESGNKHFDYRINFGVSFGGEKSKSRFIFAKGIKPLNNSLKQGWKLSNQCEIYKDIDNKWYVRVFVSKLVLRPIARQSSIGIDVGIKHITATSESHLGNSLSKRLNKLNQSKSEKLRQFSLAKDRKDHVLVEKLSKNLAKNKNVSKTIIKQLLDKEAKKIIARGLSTSSNLVVEDPKALANLRGSNRTHRWAKTYFAYRLQVLGKEKGVFVVFTNPAYTSITCSKCGDKDKKNRNKLKFHCLKCGHQDHSDVNAAKNLERKGQEFVETFIFKNKDYTLKET